MSSCERSALSSIWSSPADPMTPSLGKSGDGGPPSDGGDNMPARGRPSKCECILPGGPPKAREGSSRPGGPPVARGPPWLGWCSAPWGSPPPPHAGSLNFGFLGPRSCCTAGEKGGMGPVRAEVGFSSLLCNVWTKKINDLFFSLHLFILRSPKSRHGRSGREHHCSTAHNS